MHLATPSIFANAKHKQLLSSKERSRRSLPPLGPLHITPLSYEPIGDSPVLDDEELPEGVQRSYLSSRSLPQTPSILSRSPSRSNSRTRNAHAGHRSAKSSLALTSLDDPGSLLGPRPPSGASTRARPKSAFASGRQTPARVRIADGENTELLLRTASLLVENACESKGQGWISKRNSTTSLGNYELPEMSTMESAYPADDEFSGTWSRVPSRNVSRRGSRRNSTSMTGSRWGSQRGSRVNMGWRTPGSSTPRSGYFEDMGLDLTEGFEGQREGEEEGEFGTTIDEGELNRLLRRRVGGFFEDVFGGWFDLRSEDLASTSESELPDSDARDADEKALARRRRQRFAGIKKEDIVQARAPAEQGGVLGDARWLLGLARNILV